MEALEAKTARFNLWQSRDDPSRWLVLEAFRERAGLEEHRLMPQVEACRLCLERLHRAALLDQGPSEALHVLRGDVKEDGKVQRILRNRQESMVSCTITSPAFTGPTKSLSESGVSTSGQARTKSSPSLSSRGPRRAMDRPRV